MNANVQRIVFTGDVLRPFHMGSRWESATWKNIRWLESLLSWQLHKATGLPHMRVAWDDKQTFNTSAFYAALNMEVNYNTWASIFYVNHLPGHIEKQLVAPYLGSCVIGIEIPDILQVALTRHRIPFIDIISHPIRFMEDLLFAFRTNDKAIHDQLLRYRYAVDDHCIPRANLLRAKVAWMPHLHIPENTALISGQVATDKALISRKTGRFLNLSDYMDKLFEICKNHPLVLFKPHPYQPADCPSRRAIETFGVIRTVSSNFYYLIAQENISHVYAINSGTVSEAPFFGKQGNMLGDALYQFSDRSPENDVTSDAIPIGNDFLNPRFWADILQDIISVKFETPPGPPPRPSLLRRSLNADWDYSFIDEVVQRHTPEVIA